MNILMASAALRRLSLGLSRLGPGLQQPLMGTMEDGFFGEVTADELIAGADLAVRVGLEAAGSYHQAGLRAGWLKFTRAGKVLFVAKQAIRYSISWNQLNNAGVVNGTRREIIKNDGFIVRLMAGTDDPATVRPTAGRPTSNSEWNRVFYPLIIGNDSLYLPSVKFDSRPASELAQLDGVGYQAFVQDVGDTTANRIIRGGASSMHYINQIQTSYSSNTGWRPVLELVL